MVLAQQRRDAIVEIVHELGGVSVAHLAARLDVSPSTIRRDLTELDRLGRLQRVRGGGAENSGEQDQPFSRVARRAAGEKDRVGQTAASLVRDRDVVLLDIGTTCAAIARHLRGRDVTVVTASLAVVDELREDKDVELIVLGGLLRRTYLSLVGSLTERALADLRADLAFVGTSGIRPDGTVLDSTGTEVPIKQAIMRACEHTVLTAASDKFPGSGLLPVAQVNDFSTLITTVAPATTPLPTVSHNTEVLFA